MSRAVDCPSTRSIARFSSASEMAYSNGVPALIRVAFDELVFGP